MGRDEGKEKEGRKEGRGPRVYLEIFLRITYGEEADGIIE